MAEDLIGPGYQCVVIGGSAGSIKVLIDALPAITPHLRLAIVVVLHRKNAADNSLLVHLLRSKTLMLVKEIEEKEPICSGICYIAPPDYHVLVEKDRTFSLDASEKVNFSRPSIDVTFESAAVVYGASLACVLLSGANSDGAHGLIMAGAHNALIAIQDPATAEMPAMPRSAMNVVENYHILQPEQLAGFINNLA